ncbi:LTA synthase family protein, partial [Streptococcus agalactiae]|nr:LTA synthase family protein [Streptococcus agalactiae]MCC9899106.1 LTA synthase family protein [Streptococcus agalactiae]
SIIVMYGDHYGISNTRNPSLAELLGKDPETWSEYDNAMLQRVPYMIHIPGYSKGFISNTYGGEVDNLPTLLHILGIDTSKYTQLGQDLLSKDNKQMVAMRTTGQYITPKYTNYSGHLYYTDSGQEITNPDETTKAEIKAIRDATNKQLSTSDSIQTGDLLRFDENNGLKTVEVEKFNYTHSLKALKAKERKLKDRSTSIYSKHNNKSTVDLFHAPSYLELQDPNKTHKTSKK